MASRPSKPALIAVSGLAIAAAVFLFVATDPVSEPPTTTLLAAPETVATTSSSSAPVVRVGPPTLAQLLPAVDGVLYAAVNGVGSNEELRLFAWRGDDAPQAIPLPMPSGPGLEFDASGESLAFIGHPDGLYAGNPRSFWRVVEGATSVVWHETLPGARVWTVENSICQHGSFVFDNQSCVSNPGTEVIGHTDRGILVRDGSDIILMSVSGAEVTRYEAQDAIFSPEGRILLVVADGDHRAFQLVDADARITNLDWVPDDVGGEYGFVAWSPTSQLAFLRFDGEFGWSVSVYWPWGRPINTIELPGRFWNVAWSNDGRHLVLPGIIDERDSLVLIVDVITGEMTQIPHPNFVQDAALATSRCMDGSPMIDGLAQSLALQDETSLLESKAVISLDPSLESWLFISSTVSDGPHHGDIATWGVPGFNWHDGPVSAGLLPMNDVADAVGGSANTLDPTGYGVDDWLELDGALESQACLSR